MRGVALNAILIFAAINGGCASTVVAGGQIRPTAFDSILKNTMRARKINIDGPVDARVVSRLEMTQVLEEALDSQWSEEALRSYERALGALGLWPRDRDLRTEGWDGDRFLVAECSGELEFAWLTAWDTERDAREFEKAYGSIAMAIAARAGLSASPEARREAREVVVVSTGLRELGAALPALARRQRVSSPAEVREHFMQDGRP